MTTRQFKLEDETTYLAAADYVVGRGKGDPRASTVPVGSRLVRTPDGDFAPAEALAEQLRAGAKISANPGPFVPGAYPLPPDPGPAAPQPLPSPAFLVRVTVVLVALVVVLLVAAELRRATPLPPALVLPPPPVSAPVAVAAEPEATAEPPRRETWTPIIIGPPLVVIVRDCFPLECGGVASCHDTVAALDAAFAAGPNCHTQYGWPAARQFEWRRTH